MRNRTEYSPPGSAQFAHGSGRVKGLCNVNNFYIIFYMEVLYEIFPVSNKSPLDSSAGTGKIIFAEDALFEYEKSTIKPSGKATLDNLINKLASKDEVIISADLSSKANSTKSNPNFNDRLYDPDLVLRRTAALKTYLVASGIDGNKISIQERNDQSSVPSNTAPTNTGTERVEIEIVPALPH